MWTLFFLNFMIFGRASGMCAAAKDNSVSSAEVFLIKLAWRKQVWCEKPVKSTRLPTAAWRLIITVSV